MSFYNRQTDKVIINLTSHTADQCIWVCVHIFIISFQTSRSEQQTCVEYGKINHLRNKQRPKPHIQLVCVSSIESGEQQAWVFEEEVLCVPECVVTCECEISYVCVLSGVRLRRLRLQTGWLSLPPKLPGTGPAVTALHTHTCTHTHSKRTHRHTLHCYWYTPISQ